MRQTDAAACIGGAVMTPLIIRGAIDLLAALGRRAGKTAAYKNNRHQSRNYARRIAGKSS